LLILDPNFAAAQVVNPEYRNLSMEDKRLVIAPLLSVDVVDSSFTEKFPGMASPRDSLILLINNELQFRMRKFTDFTALYESTYESPPALIPSTLISSRKDTIHISLPAAGEVVHFNLKGRSRHEPDFVLFIKLGEIYYLSPDILSAVVATVVANLVSGSKSGVQFVPPSHGVIFKDLAYVFWDNKLGRIVAYDQKSLIVEDGSDESFQRDAPFSPDSKYLDLLARLILTKTPFAKGDMEYLFGL